MLKNLMCLCVCLYIYIYIYIYIKDKDHTIEIYGTNPNMYDIQKEK